MDSKEIPSFQQTHFYTTCVSWFAANPEMPGKEKVELLDFAYAIYSRIRARHQIDRGLNGDGGCAVPS